MPRSPSKPRSKARIAAQLSGRRAEALAALFLRCKLYSVIDSRFRTPVGEIDLVAERFGTIVFVEVKARTRASNEVEALGAVNQARIARAAHYWLAKHPLRARSSFRFDVIFLAPGQWPRHLKNAFDAS